MHDINSDEVLRHLEVRPVPSLLLLPQRDATERIGVTVRLGWRVIC